MSGGFVRDAVEEDAIALAPRLRDIDKLEIHAMSGNKPLEALLSHFKIKTPVHKSIVRNDGLILGMFGVCDCPFKTGYGVPWLLASEPLVDHSREFLKNCRKWVAEMQKPYPVLYNYIHTQNAVAMRWLQWCGFDVTKQVEFGRDKEPFYLFIKEINDV